MNPTPHSALVAPSPVPSDGKASPRSATAGSGASLAVIVPHYERIEDTVACCRSLARQTLSPAVILVVDNASRSHGREELEAACPMASVMRLESNRGFAGGVNAGLRVLRQHPGLEFVLLLNNDTACDPRALECLVAPMLADRRVGLVGCPLLEGEDRQRVVPAGKRLMRPWLVPVWPSDSATSDYLCGACLLLRWEMLEAIGGLDESFFFFFEDADYSLRVRNRGWRLAVAADAGVRHRGSATIGRLSALQARYYRAGHVRLLRKYSRLPWLWALPPFLFRLMSDAVRLRFKSLRGSLDGWRQGWRTPV